MEVWLRRVGFGMAVMFAVFCFMIISDGVWRLSRSDTEAFVILTLAFCIYSAISLFVIEVRSHTPQEVGGSGKRSLFSLWLERKKAEETSKIESLKKNG